ncbi:DUF7619 domain-containing protein [Pontibacter roseus]|uniref:DUF7619 domain-containing protein n=1 Tax=Pontibacter roseus TaxID=336989 RepID=UPI00036D6870|nr:IPT/TIG domain-containing protein [Pontibacter roseus]
MRTTLLFIFISFFLPSFLAAQNSKLELSKVIGIQTGMPFGIAVDAEDNIYLTDFNIIKYKNGIRDHHFKLEGTDNTSYGTFKLTFDSDQNYYVLNYSGAFVEKFDKQGKSVLKFGRYGTHPGEFRHPNGIAVDKAGNIYVTDSYNNRIQKFDPTGRLLLTINNSSSGSGLSEFLIGIALDADGNIYTIDTQAKKVCKFRSDGRLITLIGTNAQTPQGFGAPSDIILDAEGNIYVSDTERNRIHVFNPQGQYLRHLGKESGRGAFTGTATYMALNKAGNILATDRRHNSASLVYEFSKEGELLNTHGDTYAAKDVALDESGNAFIVDMHHYQVVKFNAEGQEIMRFGSWGYDHGQFAAPVAISLDLHGNIYVLDSWGNYNAHVQKFSASGQFLERFTDFGEDIGYLNFTDLDIDYAGNMYITDYYGGCVRKLNASGTFVNKIGTWGRNMGELHAPLSIAVDAYGFVYVADINGKRVQRFDPAGKALLQFGPFSPEDDIWDVGAGIDVDDAGNTYLTSSYSQALLQYNIHGEIQDSISRYGSKVAINSKGTRLLYLFGDGSNPFSIYLAQGNTPTNYIEGTVFQDSISDCKQSPEEAGIAGIVVEATPGPYYGITNENGFYSIAVEPGTYSLRQILPNQKGLAIRQTCPPDDQPLQAIISSERSQVNNINFANQVTLSPHLSVSVSSDRRRRCFESVTKVRYANTGFAAAPDAKVYLQLPKEVALLSADKPYTRLPDGTYEFAVGTLGANQTGTITIQDIVTCGDESVRGRTVCTRAWITPSNNAPSKPTPTISLTARCNPETGMIRFVIRNTGTAGMETSELYRKYANGELASIEQFRLAAGDSMVFWVPSMGYTWRLEADQPDGNGDNKQVSVTIEGCSGADTTASTGMVNLLPSDDEEAEVAEECVMITDSFDPNDKLVTPAGRTKERYTPTNTALKYKIRFQNTGTDVAYRVVVVDTLSEHLDLSTLQLGAASHTYRYEVSGKGRPVLTWTFDNILLPDSTANEPGSHGYIQFSIKPKADLPEKTLVENFADIFFDFNSPVRTNVTQNRIYDMPPVISEKVRVDKKEVLATPGITAFAPAAGKYNAEVTITGEKFSAKATDNQVYLNGVPATVLSASATELKVRVPIGAATGALKVVTPDGAISTTKNFEVYQPPVLSSFSPAEGIAGSAVTLQGAQLHPEQIQRLTLNGLDLEIVSNTAQTLTVKVPAQAKTGKFELVTKGGEATSATSYVVWHQPSIHSLSKSTDIVGATIRIEGENFASTKERNKVYFGQVPAQVVEATDEWLSVQVPAGAQSGAVLVETPGGKATSPTPFELIPGPQFAAMKPARGTVGTEVEIDGLHFGIMGQQDRIAFNGEPALVLASSGNRYRVQVPRGAATGKISITGYGGVAHSTADFVVEELAPAEAIQVYPNPTSGRFTVNLRHADFDVQAVEVYDALGRLVHTTNVQSPRPELMDIAIPSAKSGLYTLRIQTDRGTITKKLTVL